VVWRYIVPVAGSMPNTQGNPPVANTTFRSYKYPLDYMAFSNNNISTGEPIEFNSNNSFCLVLPVDETAELVNPIKLYGNLIADELRLHSNQKISISIMDINGQVHYTFDVQIGEQTVAIPALMPGMYLIKATKPNSTIFVNQKFIKTQ